MSPESSPFVDLTRRLRRTDLLLLAAVRRQRARPAVRAKGQFWGAVITDDEVEQLLIGHGEVQAREDRTAELERALEHSVVLRDGPGGRVGELRRRHKLDPVDVDLLLLALAPEISDGYGRILAYLNDHIDRPFLTVGLAARVLAPRRPDCLHIQNRFLPSAPLVKDELVELRAPGGVPLHSLQQVFLTREIYYQLVDDADATLKPSLQVLPAASHAESVLSFPDSVSSPDRAGAQDRANVRSGQEAPDDSPDAEG